MVLLRRVFLVLTLFSIGATAGHGGESASDPASIPSSSPFSLPCEDYLDGLRGEGNFGLAHEATSTLARRAGLDTETVIVRIRALLHPEEAGDGA